MNVLSRPGPREAGADLLVLAHWEEFTGWFLHHTGKWPKSVRFTLTQRLENHAIDIVEMLVVARYEPRVRKRTLRRLNLTLERMRYLLRLAQRASVVPNAAFERAMRGFDETGRMVHGWRETIDRRGRPPRSRARREREAGP
ncbi:MAG: four helix bundle protein [Planctomycetota bacterium]